MIYIQPGAVYDTSKPTVLYDNLYEAGTISGLSATGFAVENVATGSTWDYWKPINDSIHSVTVTLAAAELADCAFIDAHDLATNGADFQIRVSVDGGVTYSNVTDWITPSDNGPIMVLFPETSGNAWQIRQRNGASVIGVAMIGQKLSFEYGITDPVSFRHGRTIELMGGNSLGGHFLGQKETRKGGSTTLDFPWLTSGWVNNQMAMFEDHYNSGKPFGMALNPDYDNEEVAYCWRPDNASELRPQYQQMGKSFSMNMKLDYYVA